MGYRCPVCEDPQADDAHLANHLAFTALARGGDHETWLDDNVPDWEGMGESDLATEVAALADEADYPAVFEDTTSHDHTHDQSGRLDRPGQRDDSGRLGDSVAGGDAPGVAHRQSGGGLDEETRAVLEEARELTRKRRENAREGDSSDQSPEADDP